MKYITMDSEAYPGHKTDLTWILRTKAGQDVFWKIHTNNNKRNICRKKNVQKEREQNWKKNKIHDQYTVPTVLIAGQHKTLLTKLSQI